MSSSVVEVTPLAANVRFTESELVVSLIDGRTISVPLVWFPRLLHANERDREQWELLGDGEVIHWPDADEDLSVSGLLRGTPAVGFQKSA